MNEISPRKMLSKQCVSKKRTHEMTIGSDKTANNVIEPATKRVKKNHFTPEIRTYTKPTHTLSRLHHQKVMIKIIYFRKNQKRANSSQ